MIELFLKDVLGLLAYEGTTFMPTFQVKARLYENFIAVRKYNFLDSFLTRGYARAYHELLQGQRYANESFAHS